MRLYRCKTRNEYNFLMEQLGAQGFKWNDGTPLADFDAFEILGSDLCICEDGRVSYLTQRQCKEWYRLYPIHPVVMEATVKTILPEYVVEYFEKVKKESHDVHEFLRRIHDDCFSKHEEIATRLKLSPAFCDDMLARAYLCGYDVISEQVYTVVLPNPNHKSGFKSFLCKDKSGKVVLVHKKFDLQENVKLTEREIKEFDERYMAFAQEVERDEI